MRTHAENNSIPRISMPCIGTGLDQLDWDKVELLIQETFRTSPVQVVVYILPTPETKQGDNPVDNEPTSKFAQAQEADESLKHVRRWVRQKVIPTPNDLQGLPRLAWQMYNQLSSLYLQDGILCRKFEPTNGRLAYLQQIVPPSLVTEIIIFTTQLIDRRTFGCLQNPRENSPTLLLAWFQNRCKASHPSLR